MASVNKRIASFGEAMVEFFDRGNDCWRRGFAGDSLNVAWALRALLPKSYAVDYVTRVGEDGVSSDFVSFLEESDLGTGCISRDSNRTLGLYTIKTDEQGERSFDYWRSQSAAKCVADDPRALKEALAGFEWVYLSGISAAIIEAKGRENLLEVIESLRTQGVKFAYDPNFRPKLWSSLDEMRDFTQHMTRLSSLVMPTFDDELAAFGDSTPEATTERLLNCGAEQVVVKNGTQPTLVANHSALQSYAVEQPVKPLDTTGAGDSFNGGFLSAYLQGDSLENAVHRGQVISARVVLHRGALVPYEELRKI